MILLVYSIEYWICHKFHRVLYLIFFQRKDSLNFQQDKRENSALFGLRFAYSLMLWIILDVNNGQISRCTFGIIIPNAATLRFYYVFSLNLLESCLSTWTYLAISRFKYFPNLINCLVSCSLKKLLMKGDWLV